jgi:hypothetical protein
LNRPGPAIFVERRSETITATFADMTDWLKEHMTDRLKEQWSGFIIGRGDSD